MAQPLREWQIRRASPIKALGPRRAIDRRGRKGAISGCFCHFDVENSAAATHVETASKKRSVQSRPRFRRVREWQLTPHRKLERTASHRHFLCRAQTRCLRMRDPLAMLLSVAKSAEPSLSANVISTAKQGREDLRL
jgi:hypothetical protein